MKKLKHENSLFPYSLGSIVNLPEWRLDDADLTLSFLSLFTETITPERKSFLQN